MKEHKKALIILIFICILTVIIGLGFYLVRQKTESGDPYHANFIVVSLERGQCMTECNPYLIAINDIGEVGLYTPQADPLLVDTFKLEKKYLITKEDAATIIEKFKEIDFLSLPDEVSSQFNITERRTNKIKFVAINNTAPNYVEKKVRYYEGEVPALDSLADLIDRIAKQ